MRKQFNNLPKQSLGDVIDKITILARKIRFGEEEAIQEFTYLTESLTKCGIDGALLAAIVRLALANFEIWEMENELRRDACEPYKMDEIGERAVKIRDINRKRIRYKNEINRLSEAGFREFKIRHRSQ